MLRVALVLAVCSGFSGCARPGATFAPAGRPRPETIAVPGPERLDENALLYLPAGTGQEFANCDLLVHFHGAPEVVQREFDAARLRGALVIVNFRGLSAAYEGPFSAPGRFPALLDSARERLVERGVLRPGGEWGRMWLSSFSAGYGAVRAILAQPALFERIDGIYLADSLYAGYANEPLATAPATSIPAAGGARRVNPAHVAPFRRYAAEAVAGRKVLVLTHSYLVPGTYAGTHETAADLLAFVGVEPRAADEAVVGGLRVLARAESGGLRVYGCAGDTGADHMAHLRNLRWGLGELLAVSSQRSAGTGADSGGRRSSRPRPDSSSLRSSE